MTFLNTKRCAALIAWLAVLSTLAAGAALAGGPFAWLVPAAAPSSWKQLTLPSGDAVLSYPPSLKQIKGDASSVSAAEYDGKGKVLAYLNATPRQGAETLGAWPAFRVQRLRLESAVSVHVTAQALNLSFRGGKGSCVVDDYVTRIGHNRYSEIACFVEGKRAASVIVAAARQSDWTNVRGELQRAVAAYQER